MTNEPIKDAVDLDETRDETAIHSIIPPMEMTPITSQESEDQTAHEEAEETVQDSQEDTVSKTEDDSEKKTKTFTERDVEEDFKTLKQAPYIDLYQEWNKAKQNLDELNSMKGLMDEVTGMSADTFAALVNMMDAADRKKYEGGVEEFNREFPQIYANAQYVVDMLKGMIDCFAPELVASTTFISQSMVESGTYRLENLEKANPVPINYQVMKKRLQFTVESYRNRTAFNTLFNKLSYPANIVKLFKQFQSEGPDAAMKYIDKIFKSIFNDEHMVRFRSGLTDRILMPKLLKLEGNANRDAVSVMVFFMTYWLASIHEKEYTSGKCADIKTFVMNVYDTDPKMAIYDIVGGAGFFYEVAFQIFLLLADITNGTHSPKSAQKILGDRVPMMKAYLAGVMEELAQSNPGKTFNHGTSLEECYPDITYRDIVEKIKLCEKGREDKMITLENQKVQSEFNDVGSASVDPTVMPEVVDNQDVGDTTDEEEVCEACQIHIPDMDKDATEKAPKSTGVAN